MKGKKLGGQHSFMPLWLQWEETVRGTLFFPFLIKEKKSGGFTLFPLLNEGEEEWGVHSFSPS